MAISRFSCKINGQNFDFDFDSEETLESLLEYIQTFVSSKEEKEEEIKIIWKGKRIDQEIISNQQLVSHYFQASAAQIKLIILCTSKHSIQDLQERKSRHDDAIRNYNRALTSRPKHEIITAGFARKIEVLGEFSDHLQARELLMKVRDDHAIKQIMKSREWRIGSLIELHPLKDPTILGYNQNKGMVIALRLRTDALDGFRAYSSIIKVMLHELAHMVFTNHGADFHALDRELNGDYARFKGHSVSSSYSSSSYSSTASTSTGLVAVGPQRLGGSQSGEGLHMRDILAQAATIRLSKEEQEMETRCGKREDDHH